MKPILFSTPMVRAILDGRKTMTRRVISEKIVDDYYNYDDWCSAVAPHDIPCQRAYEKEYFGQRAKYQIGDILWVRETWGSYAEDNPDSLNCDIFFRADYPDGAKTYEWREQDEFGEKIICDLPKWRPSIFMPKQATRIFLRVTSVHAERLQDITVEDAIAEGIECDNDINNPDPQTHEGIRSWNISYAQFLFRELWDHINKKRGYGWDLNPWVYVYGFEQINAQEVNHE